MALGHRHNGKLIRTRIEYDVNYAEKVNMVKKQGLWK